MALELADLFREYGAVYRKKYADKLLPSHRQAMWAIESCRTERLGRQVYGCPNCQEFRFSRTFRDELSLARSRAWEIKGL